MAPAAPFFNHQIAASSKRGTQMHFLALMRDPRWGLKEEKLLTFEVVLGPFLPPPSLGARRLPERWRCSEATAILHALRAAGFPFREVY